MIVKFYSKQGKILSGDNDQQIYLDNIKEVQVNIHYPLMSQQNSTSDISGIPYNYPPIVRPDFIKEENWLDYTLGKEEDPRGIIELVVKDKFGEKKIVLALKPVFIMNDDGKTIERI